MGEELTVTLQNVRKAYGKTSALNGLNMAVRTGELYGFLGPNGAGKTTTIRILTGFIRTTGGEASVLGLNPWSQSVELKRRIGFLPDISPLYKGLTGREFINYIAQLHGLRFPPLQSMLLERLQLSETTLAQKLKGYSHGMKKKVMLVQAMQHNPELLIMDEPTDGLDPLMRQEFFSIIRELSGRGVTVFMSSHVLSDLEDLCDRLAIIREGLIVSEGSINELRLGHRRPVTVEFSSKPPLKFKSSGVTVISRDGTTCKLLVTGDINDLIRELATYDLVDLVLERTSLEELFLDYYKEKRETTA